MRGKRTYPLRPTSTRHAMAQRCRRERRLGGRSARAGCWIWPASNQEPSTSSRQGADFPEMRRGLPLAVARDPEVLVVWGMNGDPLPVAHGGPVRLLVPGWAGIASTKWLVGIEAIDRAFDGFWNTDNYVIWDERGDPLRPVAEMPPKSVIVTPADGETDLTGASSSGRLGVVRIRSHPDR